MSARWDDAAKAPKIDALLWETTAPRLARPAGAAPQIEVFRSSANTPSTASPPPPKKASRSKFMLSATICHPCVGSLTTSCERVPIVYPN